MMTYMHLACLRTFSGNCILVDCRNMLQESLEYVAGKSVKGHYGEVLRELTKQASHVMGLAVCEEHL